MAILINIIRITLGTALCLLCMGHWFSFLPKEADLTHSQSVYLFIGGIILIMFSNADIRKKIMRIFNWRMGKKESEQ